MSIQARAGSCPPFDQLFRRAWAGGASLSVLLLSHLTWAQEPGAEAKPGSFVSEQTNLSESASMDDIDLMGLLEIDVSTATKTSESLEEAPAIISAITSEDIQRWGYQSVGEVLKHVVGFYLIDDHVLPNAAVRGMTGGLGAESSVIKVMIDGRSVAFRTTSGNWLGTELVPLSIVKQIEVIRGPASALYGADAFLGVVNIITLSPEDVPRVGATLAGGASASNPAGRFDVVSGTYSENFDLMLSAAGEWKDRSGLAIPTESPSPLVPAYQGENRYARDLHRRSLVVGARGGYNDPDRGHHLNIAGYASGIRRGGDFAHWAQLTSGVDDQGRDVGTVVNLGQFRINLDGLYQATDTFALSAQAMYFQGGVLPKDRIEVASDLYYADRSMAYSGVDANMEGRWTPHRRFNLIAGMEAVYDVEELPHVDRISKETGDVLGHSEYRGDADFLNLGAFVSTNLKVVENYLKLTAGGRYDYHNRYGSQVSGRFGITSRWSEGLVTKVLYGSAFKAPSPFLMYAQPLIPGDVIGNEDLKPQYIHTWEGQVSWKPSRVFSATTGVSYSLLQDKAEFVPSGINQTAQNTASQNSFTWESRLDLKQSNHYGGYGSFELTRSFRDLGREGYTADLVGSDMIVYPAWIGRAGGFVGLPSASSLPVELTAQAVLVGPRRAADSTIIQRGDDLTFDPYLLLNAGLNFPKVRLFYRQYSTISVRVKNLLGQAGPDPGFSGFEYPLAPRELFVQLSHRY